MIKKNLTRGLQFACGVAVVAAAVGATVLTNETKAAASAPTGVCGLILSGNAAGYTQKSPSAGFSGAMVGLTGVVNLSGGTVALTATDVNNYNTTNAYNTKQAVTGTVSVGSSLVADGSGYLVTIVSPQDPESAGLPLLFVPTNNNNTYLVSSYKDQSTGSNTGNGSPYLTGVCQAQ